MPDRIALITGASRGLGANAARHLAARGVAIIGTYNANRDAADEVAGEIERAGGSAVMHQLDVARSDTFPAFADTVADTLGSRFDRTEFDYLLNNAGIGIHAPFAETTEAQFDELVAQQLKGPFFLTQSLLGLIADGGRILNVSTGLARFTYPGFAAYASMKGATEVLTRYMAQELGERGIRANVVVPGAIATDFAGGAVRDDPEMNQTVSSRIALGRVGEPDDIGAGISAILSDDFGWANGSRIELSGGQSL